jgi:hypothetical protein
MLYKKNKKQSDYELKGKKSSTDLFVIHVRGVIPTTHNFSNVPLIGLCQTYPPLIFSYFLFRYTIKYVRGLFTT